MSAVLDALRPQALGVRDAVGQATAGRRALPTLVVAGAQRAGTTSLYKALAQQPHLFRPVWRKGVHYFDMSFDRGPEWYRGHFPLESTLRRAGARSGVRPVVFECSPYYLFHPLAATRIRDTLPDARVVVLVRDPVARAHSAHAHELARGYETLPFADALAAETGRLEGEAERLRADPSYQSHAHRHQAYRARGEYADQLDALAGVVGRDRVLVLDSHRLFAEPQQVVGELLAWLGTAPVRPGSVFRQHNARPRPPMPRSVAHELDEHFAPFDDRLEEWLGARPSWRS